MTGHPLRVLTLNIWHRQGPWETRRGLIRQGIAALKPHFIGLQEVLALDGAPANQADEIAEGMGYPHRAYARAWDIGGGLSLGNALLSQFPFREQYIYPLPSGGSDQSRSLLYAEIDAPCGPVPVFVTHLSWHFEEGELRQAQVRAITSRINALRRPEQLPPVLLGDFNAEPESDEIRYLRGLHALDGQTVAFHDAWSFCHGQTPGYTYTRRNPFAAQFHEPHRRLDYIFVGLPDRQWRGVPLDCRVVLDTPDAAGVMASDHFGVYAELATTPP